MRLSVSALLLMIGCARSRSHGDDLLSRIGTFGTRGEIYNVRCGVVLEALFVDRHHASRSGQGARSSPSGGVDGLRRGASNGLLSNDQRVADDDLMVRQRCTLTPQTPAQTVVQDMAGTSSGSHHFHTT